MTEDDLSRFASGMENELSRGYSVLVLDHAMNPRNVGRIEDADGFAAFKGPCGDTMMISIIISDGVITDAKFLTDGCGTSMASGSMVTELAKSRTLDEATLIEQTHVLKALDGLPPESEHCALLAATTLHMAIDDYRGKA